MTLTTILRLTHLWTCFGYLEHVLSWENSAYLHSTANIACLLPFVTNTKNWKGKPFFAARVYSVYLSIIISAQVGTCLTFCCLILLVFLWTMTYTSWYPLTWPSFCHWSAVNYKQNKSIIWYFFRNVLVWWLLFVTQQNFDILLVLSLQWDVCWCFCLQTHWTSCPYSVD